MPRIGGLQTIGNQQAIGNPMALQGMKQDLKLGHLDIIDDDLHDFMETYTLLGPWKVVLKYIRHVKDGIEVVDRASNHFKIFNDNHTAFVVCKPYKCYVFEVADYYKDFASTQFRYTLLATPIYDIDEKRKLNGL